MEKIKNPINRIKLLFQSLSGSLDTELNDEEGYDKAELEELNRMTAKNIQEIEKTHGIQTMEIKEEKENGKDRLGIKKPTISVKSKKSKIVEEKNNNMEIEL